MWRSNSKALVVRAVLSLGRPAYVTNSATLNFKQASIFFAAFFTSNNHDIPYLCGIQLE
jgi:hypothetical protein